ncbi:MAG: hypothetical protein ACQSGP_09260 [Frankia sp.]
MPSEPREPVPPSWVASWDRLRTVIDPVVVDRLQRALWTVQRDLDATLPDIGPLTFRTVDPSSSLDQPDLVIGSRDDDAFWSGGSRLDATDDQQALWSAAECAQDYITEVHWRVWPTCRLHNLGLHPRTEQSGHPVWWCNSHTGHIVATIGTLTTTEPT